ncbi:MAG: hypothetical protein JWM74_4495 [Myxococcaceae bacterium]|nr:hypothetical protein [Myxococcaceae bacterium]
MATLAIALLRLPDLDTQGRARVVKLDDAVLLHTNIDFSSEPEAIIAAIRLAAGDDAVDDHEDERGILVIPAVARPKAKRYDDVIAEVADLGMWIDEDAFDDDDAGDPNVTGAMAGFPGGANPLAAFGGGGLDALVGQMMGAMGPGGIEELQRAMMSGDPAAMEKVQSMMHSAMSQIGDPEEIARTLAASMGGLGEDDEDDGGEGDDVEKPKT